MTLSLKNYKGFEKRPYCNAHCPQAKATTVADTPEIRRLAENTRIQSQAKYHEDFEKSKGKNFTTIADDPETRRIKETSKIISNVAYHGEIERKKKMEERRGLSGADEGSLTRGDSGMMMESGNVINNNNNLSPKINRNSQNLSQTIHDAGAPMQHKQQNAHHHPNQHQQAQQQYQQIQLQRQQQLMQQQQLLKQQQYVAQQQQAAVNRQSIHLDQSGGRHGQQPAQHQYSQQQLIQMQRQQQQLLHLQQQQQQQQQHVNMPVMTRQPSKQAILAQTNHHMISPQHQLLNNNVILSTGKPISSATHLMQQQLSQNAILNHGQPPHGAQVINLPGANSHRLSMIGQQQQQTPAQMRAGAQTNGQAQMPNGFMPKQQQQAAQTQQLIQPNIQSANAHQILSTQQQQQQHLQLMRPAMVQAPHQMRVHPQQVPRRVYRAMYDYVANDVDEVSFYENDLLVDCVNVDRNWLIGKVARSGQTGMLPANYVTELPSQ